MYNFNHQPPILYFHSVAPFKNPRWIKSYLTLDLKLFEDLLRFISRKRLKPFFISEMDHGGFSNGNSIGLSFDDGYLDNWVYVFPLLKKYGMKATIFCSIDYINRDESIRPTLEKVWQNELGADQLESWGFCSVQELKSMVQSGLVDIQSHTITHEKLPVSGRIVDFHHPGNSTIDFYLSSHPQFKPYYITDNTILESIPYGYPIFEEKSAVLSPRVWVDEDYINEIIEVLKNVDWQNYDFEQTLKKIQPVSEKFDNLDKIITKHESDEEYRVRIKREVFHSKVELENLLGKKIDVICWPNGDFNQVAVDFAKQAGYKKIHYVETKANGVEPTQEHFIRTGMGIFKNSHFLTMLKTKARIYHHMQKFPYKHIAALYRLFK